MTPRSMISIALCTYNGAAYLPEQLRSIAAQSRLPDELVICDDRSTDGTVEILEEFAAWAPFPVQVLVNVDNLGSTRNFEKAINKCSGDVIVLSDQDDSWCANRLQATEDVLAKHPNAGAVFFDADIVDNNLKPLGYRLWETVQFNRRQRRQFKEGNAFEALLAHNVVAGTTLAFRAKLRNLIVPIPPQWVHDGWIAILISAVSDVVCIDLPLIRYRQHSSQQIGGRRPSIAKQLADTQAPCNSETYRQRPEPFRRVYERLEEATEYEVPQRVKDLVKEKIRHMSRRAKLPANRLSRFPEIAAELVSNRYRRFGYGWRGVLRDLLVNLDS